MCLRIVLWIRPPNKRKKRDSCANRKYNECENDPYSDYYSSGILGIESNARNERKHWECWIDWKRTAHNDMLRKEISTHNDSFQRHGRGREAVRDCKG
jgi:hypothetical protein